MTRPQSPRPTLRSPLLKVWGSRPPNPWIDAYDNMCKLANPDSCAESCNGLIKLLSDHLLCAATSRHSISSELSASSVCDWSAVCSTIPAHRGPPSNLNECSFLQCAGHLSCLISFAQNGSRHLYLTKVDCFLGIFKTFILTNLMQSTSL